MSQSLASVRQYLLLSIILVLVSTGCLAMVLVRVLLTGSVRYTFLLWNLFLAWIPYILAVLIYWLNSVVRDPVRVRVITVGIGLVWLFFYPNAPYILTDFIHLVQKPVTAAASHPLITENALMWYDIILNSAFSFIGHIIGLISLVILHEMIRLLYGGRLAWGVALVAIGLGGYGIYLGRFERLNSWDIFRDPLTTMKIGFLNLFNLKAVLFSLSFGFFIFLTYLVVFWFYRTAWKESL